MSARVGIIGTGWVAQDRHIPSFLADPRAAVVAVADRNVERATTVAGRFHIPAVYTEASQLLESKVDVVAICTPPQSHADIVEMALARGKHVLVEKPLAVGLAPAQRLLDTYATAGVKATVSHNFLFSRSARAAFERVSSGAAGEIVSVRGLQWSSEERRLPSWYPQLPGGLFYDEAPHLFYLVRAFAGELKLASARAWDIQRDRPQPVGHIEALFDGTRAPAHISMNFRSPVSEWVVVITGTRRVLVVDLFRDIFLELGNDHHHTGLDVLRSSGSLWAQQAIQFVRSGAQFASGRLRYGHERLISSFLDSVLEGTPEPISLADGARVVSLMDDVLKASGLARQNLNSHIRDQFTQGEICAA
ncbi:MAG: hypothetical protein NVSMB2_12500 [Chloroflexota bacterium]